MIVIVSAVWEIVGLHGTVTAVVVTTRVDASADVQINLAQIKQFI